MENKTRSDKFLGAKDREKKKRATAILRKKAEEHLLKSKPESVVFGDTRQLIQELQVHQIELEMQNDELLRAQNELRKSLDNYFDFYNFTPVGYFTFDEKGMILDLNMTSISFLGASKQDLINRNFRLFISSDSRSIFNTFCKNVIETETKQSCELQIDPPSRFVLIEGIVVPDDNGKGKRIRAVMVDITERKQMEEKLREGKEALEKAMQDIFHVIMHIVEKNTYQTPEKRQRLGNLSCAMAQEMGLTEKSIECISMAAPILNLGYIYIPVDILGKPHKLNTLEFALFKKHPEEGFKLLKDVEFPWPLAEIVLQHHERIDGSGYPRGLKGDDIMPEAKILAVADTVEEICCNQPYRPGLGINAAMDEIEKNMGILYEERAVKACVKLFREKGFKFG